MVSVVRPAVGAAGQAVAGVVTGAIRGWTSASRHFRSEDRDRAVASAPSKLRTTVSASVANGAASELRVVHAR